jgi:hypothetical protein
LLLLGVLCILSVLNLWSLYLQVGTPPVRAGKGERIDVYEGAPKPQREPPFPSVTGSDDAAYERHVQRRLNEDGPAVVPRRLRRRRKQPGDGFNLLLLLLKASTIAAFVHTVAA